MFPTCNVDDLFLFCSERSLSDDNQADVIDAFNSSSKNRDDILNTGNPYLEGMVNKIYPAQIQLNKANTSDKETHIWIYSNLFLTILCDPKLILSAKILILTK